MSTAQTEKSRPGNRRYRSLLRRHLLLVCTVVACLGILVSASEPASVELMSLSPLLILGGTFVVVVVWCVVIVYPILAVRSRRLRVDLGPLAGPALIIALTAISWSADLPMAVRWHLSAHAFDDAAQQVSAGVDPRTFEGDRLGLYRIRGVQRLDDGIYFRTGPMAAHCSMGSGFADRSGQRPATGASHHLSGDWFWFCFNSSGLQCPITPSENCTSR
ncbi:hypothetical protein [Nocardia vaccinii]|uniref:hypothetical protein n=1 Tax=Nocardia vaccinii TaxID=1822 RepID=UPI000A87A98A|nr:hypothetical protein [Nocardia vaccinii]